MSKLLCAPIYRAVDASGAPMNGAKLYFYATGTTTLQNVYTTAALSTAHANPVVSDTGGLFAAIFLDPTKTYRAVLKTSANVQVIDLDPISDLSLADLQFLQSGTGATARAALAKLRERLSPEDFGAAGNGSGDDRAAFQAAIDALAALGGGELHLTRGATYPMTLIDSVADRGVIVKDGVEIVGNGATISLNCTGVVYGVRLKNNAAIRDCAVTVSASASSPSQIIWHAPISVGDAYDFGGTPDAPSSFHFVEGWRIENVILSNHRNGGGCVVCYGGVGHGVIDGVTVETVEDADLFGAVNLDWGFLGTISSSEVPASRLNFDEGDAYTTHPHDIEIRNIRCGVWDTDEAYAVRLSGVHNITVENVDVESIHGGAFLHTAGDFGYELALSATKQFRHKGIVVRNVTCRNANDDWGAFVDCFADDVFDATAVSAVFTASISGTTMNVSTLTSGTIKPGQTVSGGTVAANTMILAQTSGTTGGTGNYTVSVSQTVGSTAGLTSTYVPLLETIQRTDMTIENFQTFSDGGGSVAAGIRIQKVIGVTLANPVVSGHLKGILVELGADEVKIVGGAVYGNREDGLYAGHGTDKPQNLRVDGLRAFQNSTAGGAVRANIYIENCDNVALANCLLGKATETATYQVRIENTMTGLRMTGNHLEAVKSSGAGYRIGSPTDYSILREFSNNSASSGVGTPMYGSGVNIITEATELGTDGVARRQCYAAKSALTSETTPTAGTWVQGERIRYQNPSANGYIGTVCVTSGSPGTWKRYGISEA